jgi:hypothetical protein
LKVVSETNFSAPSADKASVIALLDHAGSRKSASDRFGFCRQGYGIAMMLAVDRLIAAPSSAAWNVLVDLDAWPQWGPTVSGARLDSPHTELSLGATGVVRTSLGFGVPFVVTEFEPGRHWAWKVAGIPATSHRVQPVGRRTRVSISVPWWATGYLAVCSIALRRIDAMLSDAA